MARHALNRVSVTYTENDVYRAVPVARVPVSAGTRVSAGTFTSSVQFTLLTALQQAPVVVSLDVFYVPYRLVWSGWVDFISDVESVAAVPTGPAAADFFDRADGRSALFRRAYKLAYNEFYGSEAWSLNGASQAFYPNIEADTTTTLYRMRNPEPLSAMLMPQADLTDPTYPVAAPIPLRDFSAKQAAALGTLKRERSGDKYVDALARLGVSLDWRIQQAPELLGRSVKVFKPGMVVATDSVALGKPSRVLDGEIVVHVGAKFLAEEGIIVGVLGVRPVMVNKDDTGPLDGTAVNRSDFPVGTREDYIGPASVAGGVLSAGSLVASVPRRGWYHFGEYSKGFYSSPGAFTSQLDANTVADRVYPNPNAWPAANTLSGKHFGVITRSVVTGQTVVPRDEGLLFGDGVE